MTEAKYKIYMDVCCFNRPFDDLTQERIRLEAEAVSLILERCQADEWALVGSRILDAEVRKTPDRDRRQAIAAAMAIIKTKIEVDDTITCRAQEIMQLGFKPYDALHITCAEIAKADVMLTTDDRLLRRALRFSNVLQVLVENPVIWLMNVTQAGEDDENDTERN